MISVALGQVVPLTLQLFDNAKSERCVVRVYDPDGSMIFTAELDHVANGLYINKEFPMPEQSFIVAQYQVLGTDNYESPSDVFTLDMSDQNTAQMIDAAVQSIDQNSLLTVVPEVRSTAQLLAESVQKSQQFTEHMFNERLPSYHDYWTGHMVETITDTAFWEGTVLSGTIEASDT